MVKTILFDLDGTLTDPKEGITKCIQYALQQMQVESPPLDQLTWCIGPPLKTSFANLLDTRDETILNRAVGYYRERFSHIGIFENRLYADVVTSLDSLRANGVSLFLATSKPHVFAQKILVHFSIASFFVQAYGSELDGRWSEKGELIAHIIEQEGLDPDTTMMVGDRIHDIDGGKQNNTVTAAVSYGYGTPEEIAAAQPDYIFDSLAALTKAILSQLKS
jgi:phosphoglycolate phosphatase